MRSLWKKPFHDILRRFSLLDRHGQEILKGASVSFALKVAATLFSLLVNIYLARRLGAHETGIYFLALTVVSIAGSLGRVGLDSVIVRFVAASASVGEWGAVRGIYRKGTLIALTGATLAATLLWCAAPWLAHRLFAKPELTTPLQLMSWSIVPVSLFLLHAQALQGLKKIRDAVLVSNVLPPAFMIIGCLLLVPGFAVLGAVSSYVAASYFVLVIAYFRWRSATPFLRAERPTGDAGELVKTCMPLLSVTVLQLVMQWNVTIFLGRWGSGTEVGIYQMANRLAMLTSFVLVSVNTIAAPKYAAFFRHNDLTGVIETATKSTRLTLWAASPVLLLFLLFPGTVMSLFGDDFAQGGAVLRILAVGQFVNVLTGSVGQLLIMSGREKELNASFFWAACLGVVISVSIIPYWGDVGAAVSTSSGVIVVNVIALLYVKKILGFIPFFQKRGAHL